ncbi:hypothetical protein CHUAL_000240 [Chamberlinius hualienensis]
MGLSKVNILRQVIKLQIGVKCHSRAFSAAHLWDEYNKAKSRCIEEPLSPKISPNTVFACNTLDLAKFDVYGFDYDYTLACYQESLHSLIYNLGKDVLVKKYKYPKCIADLPYLPDFAVRGLHYDILKGLLLKLDSYRQIQIGTVYRGHKQLNEAQVLEAYGHLYIPIEYMEGSFTGTEQPKMQHLNDLFSLPEINLVSNVTEYFESHSIPYNPEVLFWDVRNAVQSIHPVMHDIVEKNVEKYLIENKDLRKFLERLIHGKKKLFVITNSPFSFVNEGMTFLVGNDWRQMFDVIVVQARKPKFFSDHSRPFRVYDHSIGAQSWERVTRLSKGTVYQEGTLSQLQAMTGWDRQSVLYFGDHVYSDLADLTLHFGWGTCAIISELAREIKTLNTDEFKRTLKWLEVIQQLMEKMQDFEDHESQVVIRQWEEERDQLRQVTKSFFNERFGSLFRTHHNPTYFSHRLFRFADIYMSSITNLLHYSLNHTFYPRRGTLPHEVQN